MSSVKKIQSTNAPENIKNEKIAFLTNQQNEYEKKLTMLKYKL
jgi:hypothetical protein